MSETRMSERWGTAIPTFQSCTHSPEVELRSPNPDQDSNRRNLDAFLPYVSTPIVTQSYTRADEHRQIRQLIAEGHLPDVNPMMWQSQSHSRPFHRRRPSNPPNTQRLATGTLQVESRSVRRYYAMYGKRTPAKQCRHALWPGNDSQPRSLGLDRKIYRSLAHTRAKSKMTFTEFDGLSRCHKRLRLHLILDLRTSNAKTPTSNPNADFTPL